MAIDLFPVISQVEACPTLLESTNTLVEGLAGLLDAGHAPAELAAAVRRDAGELGAALTKNTSHIAVDVRDRELVAALQTTELAHRSKRAGGRS